MEMKNVYIVEIPEQCECGYPTWSTFGIYKTREEAEEDLKILNRKAELNGEDMPRLVEKEFTTPSLKYPKLARISVLVDEDEKVVHIGRPYASVQDVDENEEDYWTNVTEVHTAAIVNDGSYYHFEAERTLYLVISDNENRENIKQRAIEFVKKEGYKII